MKKLMDRLVNVGYGNAVMLNRIVAIVTPYSAPVRRLKDEARNSGKLIDATAGRQTRSVIVTDSDHVILSSILSQTLISRLSADEKERR
jgi:regulator of extracellular matrix RemA (YlzA/DUF370 family)